MLFLFISPILYAQAAIQTNTKCRTTIRNKTGLPVLFPTTTKRLGSPEYGSANSPLEIVSTAQPLRWAVSWHFEHPDRGIDRYEKE